METANGTIVSVVAYALAMSPVSDSWCLHWKRYLRRCPDSNTINDNSYNDANAIIDHTTDDTVLTLTMSAETILGTTLVMTLVLSLTEILVATLAMLLTMKLAAALGT